MSNTIFISFSSKDKFEIGLIVHAMRSRGLSVWWADDIPIGRIWDDEIEKQLRNSRYILCFLSPNADSADRDYIFQEIEYARQNQKLIPVIIADGGKSFLIRGVIARVQAFNFDKFDEIINSEKFVRLISALSEDSVFENQNDIPPKRSIENWYAQLEREKSQPAQIFAFSIALSVAIFEDGRRAAVEDVGSDLARRILARESEEDYSRPEDFPRRRQPLLNLIECKSETIRNSDDGLEEEIVRFCDSERAAFFFEYSWSEFSQWRPTIIEWLGAIVHRISNDDVIRVSLAIGALTQAHYLEVKEELILPWLASENERLCLCADIALSAATFDPRIAKLVKSTILGWATSQSQTDQRKAIRLACGHTGLRMPGLAIEVLRHVGSNSGREIRQDLLSVMQDSMKKLLRLHVESSDDTLLDLSEVIQELSEWVLEQEGGERRFNENPFPIIFFTLALSGIPLMEKGRNRSRISLETLVKHRRSVNLLARVINFALVRPSVRRIPIRQFAIEVLKSWIATRRRISDRITKARSFDPLLVLAQELIATAPSMNDKARIRYLFRGVYTEQDLIN